MSLKQTVENVYIRQHAMQLTRKHLWRFLGITILISALTAAANELLNRLGDIINAAEIHSLSTALQSFASSQRITSTAPVINALANLLFSPKFILFNLAFILLTGLLTRGLQLGRISQEISAGRGEVPQLPGIFSKMHCCVKALGLTLWTGMKIILWMLPGFVLIFLTAVFHERLQQLACALIVLVGLCTSMALGIPAALRYALSPCLITDTPGLSIRGAIAQSAALMEQCKFQYFKLCIPLYLKIAAILFLESLFSPMILILFGLQTFPVVIILLQLAAVLPCTYITLQINMACTLFYLKKADPVTQAAAGVQPLPAPPLLPENSAAEPLTELPSPANEEKENAHE